MRPGTSVIIAIDGPAASGKGTLARRLADHFGLAHLDTGKTYRAVAYLMASEGADLTDEAAALAAAERLDLSRLSSLPLTSHALGEAASRVAVHPALRDYLVDRQRLFASDAAKTGHGAVLDGRDVGTVVLPDADVKLFVTADVAQRARRRSLELHGTSEGTGYAKILAGLRERDRRDAGRTVAPMKPATDAMIIDTTRMTADEAFATARGLVENAQAA